MHCNFPHHNIRSARMNQWAELFISKTKNDVFELIFKIISQFDYLEERSINFSFFFFYLNQIRSLSTKHVASLFYWNVNSWCLPSFIKLATDVKCNFLYSPKHLTENNFRLFFFFWKIITQNISTATRCDEVEVKSRSHFRVKDEERPNLKYLWAWRRRS